LHFYTDGNNFKEKMKKWFFGNNLDRMNDVSFRVMAWMYRVQDFFRPVGPVLNRFGIRPGDVVMDLGCGPGRYIHQASMLAGPEGTVYALDIHPLAIESVEKLIRKHFLENVRTLLFDGKTINLPDRSLDLVYALDMFHMVSEPEPFLREIARICRSDGVLILEDGHQPRKRSKKKVEQCGLWKITEENDRYMRLALVQ